MNEVYDRLNAVADRLERKQRYSDRNRLALLTVHGIMGMAIGIASVIDGTAPSLLELYAGQPLILGPLTFLPSVGGTILIFGLLLHRNLLLEAVGMVLMLAWDVFMGVSLAVVAYIYAHDSDPLTHAASYPVAVYLGIGALMAIHLVTLVQLLREDGGVKCLLQR